MMRVAARAAGRRPARARGASGCSLLGGVTYAEQRSFLSTASTSRRSAATRCRSAAARRATARPGFAGRRPRRPTRPPRRPARRARRDLPLRDLRRAPRRRRADGCGSAVDARTADGDARVADAAGTTARRPAVTVEGRDGDALPRARHARRRRRRHHRRRGAAARRRPDAAPAAARRGARDRAASCSLLGAARRGCVVRLGLRPLDRIGRDRGRDRRRRPLAPRRARRPRAPRSAGSASRSTRCSSAWRRAFAERQASEDRLRQFLADASHELRTPLSSIRGYAELFRIGAAREPADIEKAMRRIEEEAARMGVLVEDLLDARAARRGRATSSQRARRPRPRSRATRVDDARATAPDRAIDARRRRRRDRQRRPAPAAPGARQPAAQRARAHARRARRSR